MNTKYDIATFTETDAYGYPQDNIDPKKKDDEWGMQYAKAAWWDFSFGIPRSVFFNSYDKYEELRLYALGKQPVDQYKKWMGIENEKDETALNIDWTVPAFISKFRGSALDRVSSKKFEVVCTPIDALAKTELDKIYAGLRAKIAARQVMQNMNSDLTQHPMIKQNGNEPWDEEELNMRIDFGEQFNRAKDAEEVISLAFYKNNIEEIEKEFNRGFFDDGVAGYYEDLDENSEPYARPVDVECIVTNYCKYKDFRDLRHAGELIDVSLTDLATKTDDKGNILFDDEQMEWLKQNVAGRWNAPAWVTRSSSYYKGYDNSKVKVLQLQFFSYNEYVYRDVTDQTGNKKFYEDDYWRGRKSATDKYIRKRIKVVYKINWVVGTNLCYGFGLKENQKRAVNPKHMGNTELSYRFYAPNFYAMRCQSYMERARPFIDQACMAWYRIQNFKARMVPAGWFIDLDAIEAVALNKAGENMTPKQLINFFFQSGILAGRLKDVAGDNQNYKGPVIPIANSVAQELVGLFNDLMMNLNQIEQICGGNSITSGNPNPKTLSPGYELANEATDSALAEIVNGRNYLINKLAADMYIRAQQSIKIKGNFEGYSKAVNSNTLRFIKASDSVPLKDVGIIIRMAMTDEQRQFLIQESQQDRAAGLLDTSDMMLIFSTYNFKQAQQMIAYRVKRNKQIQQQNQQAIAQQTIQGQQQSAQQNAQMQLQLEQIKGQLKDSQIDQAKHWDFMIAQMKTKQLDDDSKRTNDTKMLQHMIPPAQNPESSKG